MVRQKCVYYAVNIIYSTVDLQKIKTKISLNEKSCSIVPTPENLIVVAIGLARRPCYSLVKQAGNAARS